MTRTTIALVVVLLATALLASGSVAAQSGGVGPSDDLSSLASDTLADIGETVDDVLEDVEDLADSVIPDDIPTFEWQR